MLLQPLVTIMVAVLALCVPRARAVADEPGCVRFEVSHREDDATRWLFYEVYTDAAALDAHRASAHYAKYAQVADRVLTSKTITRYAARNITSRNERTLPTQM